MNEEFESGVEEYLEARNNKRIGTASGTTNIKLKRICHVCGQQSDYSVAKLICDNCGARYKDYVLKNSKGVEIK